ncbi:MAG: hypothetical protein K0S61_2947 [Anaerocolumna sp.]|jgi:putative acetyltransferase|nr:hypothetical protein [Anaerocolumna sp.]
MKDERGSEMKALETERLLLREWQEEDCNDLYEYAKNPKVGPMAGWIPHESVEKSKEIVNMFIESNETWAICLKETGRVIGSIGLHPDRKRSYDSDKVKMLGYVLAEEYWGQGLIPEAGKEIINFAFQELQLEILSVFHFSSNPQSKRVIEKLGFTYEGTLRKSVKLQDGTIVDSLCYSMLKEELH